MHLASLCLQQFARQAPEGVWQRDLYENVTQVLPAPVRPLGIETGTKLYISNLDYGVSNDDIKVSSALLLPEIALVIEAYIMSAAHWCFFWKRKRCATSTMVPVIHIT